MFSIHCNDHIFFFALGFCFPFSLFNHYAAYQSRNCFSFIQLSYIIRHLHACLKIFFFCFLHCRNLAYYHTYGYIISLFLNGKLQLACGTRLGTWINWSLSECCSVFPYWQSFRAFVCIDMFYFISSFKLQIFSF